MMATLLINLLFRRWSARHVLIERGRRQIWLAAVVKMRMPSATTIWDRWDPYWVPVQIQQIFQIDKTSFELHIWFSPSPASYPTHRRLPSEKANAGTRTDMSEQPGLHTLWRLCRGNMYPNLSLNLVQDDGACRIGDNLVEDDISLRQAGQDQGCRRGQVCFHASKH